MNKKQFRKWLKDHYACADAIKWLDTLSVQTPRYVWKHCPKGEWLLWLHERSGTDFAILAPVAYRAANRAMLYAGISTVTVVDQETAAEAAEAADAAMVAGAADAAIVSARVSARVSSASMASRASVWAADAARAAENLQCANDCRELLNIPGVLLK